jgi:hypothetical protein
MYMAVYSVRTELVEAIIQESAPRFLAYFNSTLRPMLDENIKCVMARPEVNPGWTNNNAESMNHVLKMAIDWRPQASPTLVDTIRDIVKGQYIDAERAFVGRGEYRLAPAMSKFALPPAAWCNKTPEQRKLWWNRFMRCTVPVTSNPTATTPDGSLTILTSAATGKKPGPRRKRTINSKTRTASTRLASLVI